MPNVTFATSFKHSCILSRFLSIPNSLFCFCFITEFEIFDKKLKLGRGWGVHGRILSFLKGGFGKIKKLDPWLRLASRIRQVTFSLTASFELPSRLKHAEFCIDFIQKGKVVCIKSEKANVLVNASKYRPQLILYLLRRG